MEFPDPAWDVWQALPLWTNGDAIYSGGPGSLHIAAGMGQGRSR